MARVKKAPLPRLPRAPKRRPPSSPEKLAFIHIMRCHAGVVSEYYFAPGRKFRADFALPSRKVLIEYEGIIAAKSRHTSITGYTKDTEKYNLAALLGFRVLRYTALNFRQVWRDLEAIFKEPPL